MIKNVVTDYGADSTGVNDATTAISSACAAVAAAGGGICYIPAGTYKCNTAQIPVGTGLHIIGDGYQSTTISATAGGSYLFNMDPPGYSTTTHVEDLLITGLNLNTSGMDIFWGSNIVRSRIVGNYLQYDASHSAFNVRQSTGTNGATYMAECEFANKEIPSGGTRSTEAWHLDFTGTGLRGNDNVWHGGGNKIWTQPGAYWLLLMGDATVTGSKHNTWRDLVFECSGGSGGHIHLQNTTDWVIDNVSSEDLSSGTVSNPLILCDTYSTGPGCSGGRIVSYSRRSGSNISNTVPDIKLDANATGITITAPSQSSGGTQLTVDFASGQAVRLGAWPTSTLLNATNVTSYV